MWVTSYYICFCLTLLSMIISRSVYVAASGIISYFLWLSSILLRMCVRMCVCIVASQGHGGKEATCQCWRCRSLEFNPWVRKIPWSRKWRLTLVFLPQNIPRTKEPGRLQTMGLQRVRHNWATKHTVCIYTLRLLYPFICCWTFMLLLCSGYCK